MNVFDPNIITGEKTNFIASVEQVINQLTLDNLIKLKAQGGTLGALSDQERVMLSSAATKIGSLRIGEIGNVKGYRGTQENFVKELTTIRSGLEAARVRAGGTAEGAASNPFSGTNYTQAIFGQ